MGGRVLGQVLAVIGDVRQAPRFDVVQGIGQGHIAMGVMMAVGFAVSGDVHELWPAARVRETAYQPLGEVFAVGEQVFKSHGLRNGSVIKEQVDVAAGGQIGCVSTGGINPGPLDVTPALTI